MTREKKKLTYQQLEEHVVYWATDQLDDLRQIADNIYRDTSIQDDRKEFIYDGIANQVSHLIDLMTPLSHDEEHLMLWATEFVDEYATFNNTSLDS